MFKKIIFVFISLWFFVASFTVTLAADDVTLSDLRFRSTPPVVNLANRLYLTFRNNSNNDRARIISVSYNLNNTSYSFGTSQTVDILANSTASVFIDDTPKLRGNVQFVIDLYSEQASICSTIPTSSKVATYTQTVFVDGDNDGDTIPDSIDPDDDNDGLLDTDETRVGTDPLNPDTDRDGQKDGTDPCPLDAQNTCVTPTSVPTSSPTPTQTTTSGSTNPTPTSTQTTNSSSSSTTTNTIQTFFANLGQTLGLTTFQDDQIIDPTVLGDSQVPSEIIVPQVAGIADETGGCLECKVWPVILGVLVIVGVFNWLVLTGVEDHQRKWWWLAGLAIPVLGYILFILINKPCIKPQLIFSSDYFWCKWFTFVDFGLYIFSVLFTKFLSKNKS